MADFTVRLNGTDPKQLLVIKQVIDNPEPILKQIGIVLLAQAQKAFRDQRLGDIIWPARYGGRPPHANIAGIIADFRAGKAKPPARRFQDRPAGIDTGQTLRSLTAARAITTMQNTVQVQTNTIGGRSMQEGSESVQLITKQVKKMLAEWMRHSRRRVKREKGRSQPIRAEDYSALNLGWLFSKKSLKTKIAARPFLGITPETERKIIAITGGEFVKATKK
jgi:hypothetical protein